jgi:hypothetical protein
MAKSNKEIVEDRIDSIIKLCNSVINDLNPIGRNPIDWEEIVSSLDYIEGDLEVAMEIANEEV